MCVVLATVSLLRKASKAIYSKPTQKIQPYPEKNNTSLKTVANMPVYSHKKGNSAGRIAYSV